ncbi:MAG: hypothetical protein JWR24_813 [Actinoallomurus sp.]|jgi:hypothetical protein|nr:hypothetical protein [Actinoallomurus sp.]
MLTRLCSTVSVLILTAGTVTAVTSGTASAGPCTGTTTTVTCSSGTHLHYGGSGGTGPGGGGGGGNSGPGLGCPNLGNTIACPIGNNPAPVAHIPTIDVAYNARDGLIVPAPHIHTAPAGRSYVQIKTGLWVDQADFATKSVTVPAPDQSVTATATPQSVTWKMGEGTTTCQGPGVAGGTQCGYTYQRSSANQPNGEYTISATTTWNVTWTCTGNCDQAGGTLNPLTLTTTAQLGVGEVQTESRPG